MNLFRKKKIIGRASLVRHFEMGERVKHAGTGWIGTITGIAKVKGTDYQILSVECMNGRLLSGLDWREFELVSGVQILAAKLVAGMKEAEEQKKKTQINVIPFDSPKGGYSTDFE